ncbi:OprD family outer membrane porin [Pseudomonas sp. PDM09]|uniref:OprD family outer membrane porin n=1 Tax=Pseudomonas sp. PDM09 TaxID=2769270 RepID=UPI00298BDC9A|nr:OprD family outer membrane porin [Pseudomonas sp. PDM09]
MLSQFFTIIIRRAVISDVRYFSASETGDEGIGDVNNRTFSTMLSYRQSGHTFGAGFQKAWGIHRSP